MLLRTVTYLFVILYVHIPDVWEEKIFELLVKTCLSWRFNLISSQHTVFRLILDDSGYTQAIENGRYEGRSYEGRAADNVMQDKR